MFLIFYHLYLQLVENLLLLIPSKNWYVQCDVREWANGVETLYPEKSYKCRESIIVMKDMFWCLIKEYEFKELWNAKSANSELGCEWAFFL